ncbi:MAG: methyltransferase [Deltaproteobacteria bacterium]|nr:methyltransferase [Deltaproteobacteria bacterium]
MIGGRPPRAVAPPSPGGGIIRPARRPRDWIVPGPAPCTPADRPEVWPREGEDLCFLAGDWRILQRVDGHRWSLDDLVTAWWAARVFNSSRTLRPGSGARSEPRPEGRGSEGGGARCVGHEHRVVDLGCGIGTVMLLLAWRLPAARVAGVEAQGVSVELARRSILFNGVEDRCTVLEGDFRECSSRAGLGPADLVTGTPPYLPRGSGTESSRPQSGPCHFEHRGGVEEYVRVAAELLAGGGVFVGCAAARQRPRVEASAADAGLAVESWREVVPREGKAPLFAVYAVRRRVAPGVCVCPPPLVVRDRAGCWTAEFASLREEMGLPPGDGASKDAALCSIPDRPPVVGPRA